MGVTAQKLRDAPAADKYGARGPARARQPDFDQGGTTMSTTAGGRRAHAEGKRTKRPGSPGARGRLRRGAVLSAAGALAASGLLLAYGGVASATTLKGNGSGTTPTWAVSNSETSEHAAYTWQFDLAGAVDVSKVTMSVPSGTTLGGLTTSYVSGIGAGTFSSSGTTITYTVTSPVSIPATTAIEISVKTVVNTSTAGSYTSTVEVYNDTSTPSIAETATLNAITFGASSTSVSVEVPESTTFTDSAPTVTLEPVPGGVQTSAPVDLAVTSNAKTGFTLDAWSPGLKTVLTSSSTNVFPQMPTTASTTYTSGEFAAKVATVTSGAAGTYATVGDYFGFATAVSGAKTLLQATAPTGTTPDKIDLTYTASATYSNAAGKFVGTIDYVVTPTY
jgi:hypothetical protein